MEGRDYGSVPTMCEWLHSLYIRFSLKNGVDKSISLLSNALVWMGHAAPTNPPKTQVLNLTKVYFLFTQNLWWVRWLLRATTVHSLARCDLGDLNLVTLSLQRTASRNRRKSWRKGDHHSAAFKCFRLEWTHATSVHSPFVETSPITSSKARGQGSVGEHMDFSGQ